MKHAITGLGVVSAIGIGRGPFEDALGDRTATRRAFEAPKTILGEELTRGLAVAEASGFDASSYLGAKGHRNFDRLTKMLIVAAKSALEDAGVKRDGAFVAYGPDDVGVCSATAYGSLEEITELNRVAELEDPRYINPTRFPNTVINAPSGYVSIWEELRAPNTTLVDGNSGALDALLHACVHLERSRGKAFVAGGGEVLTEPLLLGLRRLGFASATYGVGEGAVYVVVEREGAAHARGAKVLGYVLGYGSAFEPPERESELFHASPDAIERAVRDAIADARLAPSDVDAVVSAASGLATFDAAEASALARIFPDGRPTVAGKSFVGETFGASSAFNLAIALAWLGGTKVDGVAPTVRPRTVVIVGVGYYGNVSAVVVGRD